MKTDKQLMNEIAINSGYLRTLSRDESEGQKLLLLDMYKDISCLCDKHELIYMMGGGSCLGAVRHRGYIPWDDDLDIIMPRQSYNKLICLLAKGELGEKYEYEAPDKKKDSKNTFLKIYRKGTLNVEIINETAPGPKGVYLDFFPIDYAPRYSVLRYIKGLFSDFLHAVSSCVLYTEYPSKYYKEYMQQTKEGQKRYRQRMILGRLFGIIPHRKWVWWFDKFNSCSTATGVMTIPTGRKHYLGECHKENVFLPVAKATFEGIAVNVPHNTHEYLLRLYGDYMKIPSADKRERHFVYKFSLDTTKK